MAGIARDDGSDLAGRRHMRVKERHEYTASSKAVFALFTDRNEIEAKHRAIGARNIEITECTRTMTCASVEFTRQMPISVPAFLKTFLQPWNTAHQVESWSRESGGVYTACVAVDIEGVPVSIHGTLRLAPTKSGCVNEIDFEFGSSVPLIGRKLVSFVAEESRRIMQAEYRYLTERLAEPA
jgi:hypothetical protein